MKEIFAIFLKVVMVRIQDFNFKKGWRGSQTLCCGSWHVLRCPMTHHVIFRTLDVDTTRPNSAMSTHRKKRNDQWNQCRFRTVVAKHYSIFVISFVVFAIFVQLSSVMQFKDRFWSDPRNTNRKVWPSPLEAINNAKVNDEQIWRNYKDDMQGAGK